MKPKPVLRIFASYVALREHMREQVSRGAKYREHTKILDWPDGRRELLTLIGRDIRDWDLSIIELDGSLLNRIRP